jgi:hypothetical protein
MKSSVVVMVLMALDVLLPWQKHAPGCFRVPSLLCGLHVLGMVQRLSFQRWPTDG